MQWLLFHLVSGDALFSGVFLGVFACVLTPVLTERWEVIASRIAMFAGILLIGAAAVPLPWAVYGVWGLLLVVWMVVAYRKSASSRRVMQCAAIAVIVCSTSVIGWEMGWRSRQHVRAQDVSTMYVIGDSLSAASDVAGESAWPGLLQDNHRVEVINLAQVGATVRTAREQASQVSAGDSLVLIEIGGNDLLGDTTVQSFRDDLDALLTDLKHPGRQLVMLELPLLPLYNGYGQAQRESAARHGVVMIPRRHLAGVIFAHDSTVDSLHLSATGHRRMAEMIWDQVSGAFTQTSRHSLQQLESD